MRDAAADAYRAETGDTWRPRRGSNVSQTGKLTSAAIDARDFMRARETRAHLPQGTLVAITGGKEVRDANAIFARLDKTKAKYDDMVLVHGGGPGVEKVAAQWAERNGVHQVVCKPDWNGRAAPFRRNDELLNLLPKGVIAFPGSGITDNLVDKARRARHPGAAQSPPEPHRTPQGSHRFGGAARFLLWSDAIAAATARPAFASRAACGAALPPHGSGAHPTIHHVATVAELTSPSRDARRQCAVRAS